jgi:hypothetical protein
MLHSELYRGLCAGHLRQFSDPMALLLALLRLVRAEFQLIERFMRRNLRPAGYRPIRRWQRKHNLVVLPLLHLNWSPVLQWHSMTGGQAFFKQVDALIEVIITGGDGDICVPPVAVEERVVALEEIVGVCPLVVLISIIPHESKIEPAIFKGRAVAGPDPELYSGANELA